MRSHEVHEPLNLNQFRALAMEELKKIPQIPVDDFISHLLPSVHVNFDEAQKHLEQHASWIDFMKVPPRNQQPHDDDVYRPLSEIFNALARALEHQKGDEVGPRPTVTTRMDSTPTCVLNGPKNFYVRPDAVISVLVSRMGQEEKDLHWFNVACPFEFKERWSTAGWEDNAAKVIWHMAYLMANDPTRRFVFGVTIEDVDMRLWYCDRVGHVVSEKFDFTSEEGRRFFVRTFASLACAEVSQLGFDASMTRIFVEGSDEGSLEIKVDGRTFCTTRLLSYMGADRVCGRGTRVWEVYEKDDPTRVPRVLKDCWAETSRRREGYLYALIMAQALTLSAQAQRATEHLLTVLCHGDVSPSAGYPDDTASIRKSYTFSTDCPTIDLVQPTTGEPSASLHLTDTIGAIPHIWQFVRAAAKNSAYPRTHYRIVFEELGQPASSLADMKSLLTTLVGAAKALNLLDKCGFIHCDISIHNLLLVGNTGKLCDLEFVRESDGARATNDAYNDRTGTPEFLAHELLYGRYFYTSPEYRRRTQGTKTFTQHILHDAESLWWVFVWMLAYHDKQAPLPTTNDSEGDTNTHQNLLNQERHKSTIQLFVHHMLHYQRKPLIMDEGVFAEVTESFPPTHTRLLRAADTTRRFLSEWYLKEATWIDKPDLTVLSGVYEEMIPFLEVALGYEGDIGRVRCII
ncbi:hypothetical protein BOTBODRAFT_126784 [Botryobasidium botryosum FD-172 SS1]|uniref:Fungal-type protein kinase domain-containing protein n=1 Tax=Botryobasidium botryosum (strain FD-172 SS1) TaxID=930990 RepID=A0A067N5A8_BOTB1|nr:hypothetical protein BOTBODRAFT_126784 [Botryobasidium botryosum FD-172 SS1]